MLQSVALLNSCNPFFKVFSVQQSNTQNSSFKVLCAVIIKLKRSFSSHCPQNELNFRPNLWS